MKRFLSLHPIPSGKVAASQLALIGSLIVSGSKATKDRAEGWREHAVIHKASRGSS